jgi:AsmA protein
MAMTETLGGTSLLTATQGSLAGFNVEQLLRRLERRPLSGGGDFRKGRTAFDKLTVKLKLAAGVAAVEDVRLESATVRLALTGSASIPARDMNLKGTASLVSANPTDAARAFELPFVVDGPWDDPIVLPDAESLIHHSGAAAPLLDAVKDRRTRDAVRSAIERLSNGALPSSVLIVPAPGGAPEGPQ